MYYNRVCIQRALLAIVRGALSKGSTSVVFKGVTGDLAISNVVGTCVFTSKLIGVQPQGVCRMEMPMEHELEHTIEKGNSNQTTTTRLMHTQVGQQANFRWNCARQAIAGQIQGVCRMEMQIKHETALEHTIEKG